MHAYSVIVLILIIFCFSQCKKEHTTSTRTLYNQPLKTIQSFIQGKWKLQYEKGGICAICINDFKKTEYLLEFNSYSEIKQTYNNTIFTDTTIIWKKDVRVYNNGDSTFIKNFYDKRGYPSNYIVDKFLMTH